MARTLRVVLDALVFPEGPRWREGELWFSDMHAHEIVAMRPDGSRRTALKHNGPVSGLGWLPDGRLLFVSMEDRKLMREERDGTIVMHADLGNVATWHCNDMVVDREGRAYVGNFGFSLNPPALPMPAKLALIQPNGSVSAAAENLMFPNGMVITPDGKTLVVAETFGGMLTSFDIGPEGALSNRQAWAAVGPAVPDGICLDADGAIWVASPTSKEVMRVKRGGEITERIATETMAIACMLGGADRKTLYVLTSVATDPEETKRLKGARIEAVAVDVAAAGLP
jgi:sugar lactone lactonase YvrE